MLKRSDKFKLLATAIVTFGTLITALMLWFMYDRKDLAEIATILGILLGINTLSLILSFTVDITEKSDNTQNEIKDKMNTIRQVNEILDLYLKIDDEDFNKIKNLSILSTRQALTDITHKRIEIKDEETYYDWLYTQMKKMKRGDKVFAVSVMEEYLWIDTEQEIKFYNENVAAKNRDVKVQRIFVTNQNKLLSPKNREIILNHLNDGIEAYIRWENTISKELMDIVGKVGFIIFNEKLILIDTNLQPAQGIVSKRELDLINYNDDYRKLLPAKDAFSTLKKLFVEYLSRFEKKYTNIKNLEETIKEKEDETLKLDLEIWKGIISDNEKLTMISKKVSK